MTVVREQDGIEAQSRKGRALVLPGCGDRFDGIIEGHPQRVVARLDEGLASVPVNANRRLTGPVEVSSGDPGPWSAPLGLMAKMSRSVGTVLVHVYLMVSLAVIV